MSDDVMWLETPIPNASTGRLLSLDATYAGATVIYKGTTGGGQYHWFAFTGDWRKVSQADFVWSLEKVVWDE